MTSSRYILLLPVLAAVIFSVPARRVAGDNEEKMCPVHHLALKKGSLKVVYGSVTESCNTWDRAKAEAQYFPYANSVVYGGHLNLANLPKYQEVLYCAKCREVEETWPCLETRETPMVTKLPNPRITRLPTVR